MKTIVPNYYKNFRCIADKCRHSCCIGWEIDIDSNTYGYYRSLKGVLGKKLEKNIQLNDDVASFILTEKERCPFLCQNGLCEIISELGEGALCQICADHPRFRTYLSDRTEVGLGLCCEEACRLILSNTDKFSLRVIEDNGPKEVLSDKEKSALNLRDGIFKTLQNRKLSLEKILQLCASQFRLPTTKQLYSLFSPLERLDSEWDSLLELLNADIEITDTALLEEYSTVFEQLAFYFIYRHFLDAALRDESAECVAFAVLSCRIISKLCAAYRNKNGSLTLDDIIEIARLYSSEIEYSEENTHALFDTCRLFNVK